MSTTRILNFFFLIVFVLASVFALSHIDKRYDQLVATREAKKEAAQQLGELEAKIEAKKRAIYQLNHDPEYVEKIIRQKLNYAKSNETIFKFEFQDR